MIVVMEADAEESVVERVVDFLVRGGFDVHSSRGKDHVVLGVAGAPTSRDAAVLREFPGVADVVEIGEPFRLASRRFRREATVVDGPWGRIGGGRPWIGVEVVGVKGPPVDATNAPKLDLPYAVAAGRPFDAAVTRERVAPDSLGALACLTLHEAPARPSWPVLFVVRPPSAGATAWIARAEKELHQKQASVVLLEAGGEYPDGTRTLDVAGLVRARRRTHLPIVVDVPSIAQRSLECGPLAAAAIAAGADGVVLRAWVGPEAEPPRLPATLSWQAAMALAERLRSQNPPSVS